VCTIQSNFHLKHHCNLPTYIRFELAVIFCVYVFIGKLVGEWVAPFLILTLSDLVIYAAAAGGEIDASLQFVLLNCWYCFLMNDLLSKFDNN